MGHRHDDSKIRERMDAIAVRLPRSDRAGAAKPNREAARGLVRLGPRHWPCVFGEGAIAALKREGDRATPLGRFDFRRVLYRADRISRPRTALPVRAIKPDDGWCDAPADRNYNRPVVLPYGASAEAMWRQDVIYDLVVVLGHNDRPRKRGRGSAVFMHVWASDHSPTAGCLALAREDLLQLVSRLGPTSALNIQG